MFNFLQVPQIVHVVLLVIGILHVLRTNRPWWWILVLSLFPGIGFLIYFFVVWLPELRNGPTRVPGVPVNESGRRRIQRLRKEIEEMDTVERRMELAEALHAEGDAAAAAEQLEKCDTGPYRDDVYVLMGLAAAYLDCPERAADAKATVERLQALDSREKPRLQALLHARALAVIGQVDEAKEAFGKLGEPEARCRYGLLLKETSDDAAAAQVFDFLVLEGKRASEVWLRQEGKWVDIAKRERKSLKP